MIIATHYTINYDEAVAAYKIHNIEAPLCPDCKALLSGYDSRRRHVKDTSGNTRWFLLRRLRCHECRKLHLELPDFMRAKKHYESQIIDAVLAGVTDFCPADPSTIRRWRSKNHPPGLPFQDGNNALILTYNDKKEDKP